MELLDYLERLSPYLALAAVLAALVVAVNVLGRRLDKHADWLRLLDAKVGNLDKRREATWARVLARPYGAPAPSEAIEPTERQLVPPPLPPRAPTLDAKDWRDDDSVTEEMLKKDTGRYPHGVPPKGTEP